MSKRTGYALLLVLALALQVLLNLVNPRTQSIQLAPTELPNANWLTLLGLGESQAIATVLNLTVQSLDAQNGQTVSLTALDSTAVHSYLRIAAELSPQSAYPLFLGSRIYASVLPSDQAVPILNWVQTRYRINPRQHWPWLAYAVHLAKHRFDNLPLAQSYANTLRRFANHPDIPAWAREAEIFLLAELNELSAAQQLIGAMIANGQLRDQRALAVMINELERLKSENTGRRMARPDRRPKFLSNSAENTNE